MNKPTDIETGKTYEIPHPFTRHDVEVLSWKWRPGAHATVFAGPDDCGLGAHGVGAMLLRVVSIHRPGRYPTRVFYVRQWRDPDGNVFGNQNLRILSIGYFRRLLTGSQFSYELVEFDEKAARERIEKMQKEIDMFTRLMGGSA